MADRRSQYEGVNDFTFDPPPVAPPRDRAGLTSEHPGDPGYQQQGERGSTPPTQSDNPAVIPTESSEVKVHSGITPVPDVHPEPISEKILIEDRDPSHMNDLVKVEFEDVFAEPDGTHSFDQIWKLSFLVFNGSKVWCYRILSAVFALPCAVCWGVNFACLQFDYIWCVQPYLRVFTIKLKPIAVIWGACLRAIIDPLFESCGKVLSNIKISSKKEY